METFKHRELIGYVSQKSNSFNSGFPSNCSRSCTKWLNSEKLVYLKAFQKKMNKKQSKALQIVGMERFARQNIGELSGGQQQRVFIARALAGNPDLLVMDEPTVGIDQTKCASFYSMLNELNREHGIAIVLVTHEIDLVTDLATHVACLNRSIHFHGIQSDYKKMGDERYFEMVWPSSSACSSA